MSKSSLFSCFSTALLALSLVGQAGATTVTIGGTAVAGEGQESSVAGAVTQTFDGLATLPSGFVAAGATPASGLATGSLAGIYATPAGDTSTFVSTGTGTITDSAIGSSYFGFYWGSIDGYNTLTLTDSSGAVFTIAGGEDGTTLGDAEFVNFASTAGTTFTTAVFSSSVYAFEFDNVTTGGPVSVTTTPEPGTIAMLAGGLLILGGAVRRRKA